MKIDAVTTANNQDFYYIIEVETNSAYLNSNMSLSIFKTNSDFALFDMDDYSFRYNTTDIDMIDISLVDFTPNGTDLNEIHSLNIMKPMLQNDYGQTTSPNSKAKNLTFLCLFSRINIIFINVSASSQTIYSFTAFEQCRNAKFLFRICNDSLPESSICISPPWVSFNNTSADFTVDTSKITSAGKVKLIFQAQLIGYSITNLYANNTISTSSSYFNFMNENCVLAGSQIGWYVITQNPKNFTLEFDDKESDIVLVNLVQARDCNVYIQRQSNLKIIMIVMCDSISVSQSTITIKYTDKYHQDAQLWTEININIRIFASEPPEFSTNLNPLQINMCNIIQLDFSFPEIVDIDSNLFNISFIDSSIDWIKIEAESAGFQISSNCFKLKLVDTSPQMIPHSTSNINIIVRLSDNSEAYTDYNLNVELKLISQIRLNQIDNFKVSATSPSQFPLNIGTSKLSVLNCYTGQSINWICYSNDNKLLYVYDQDKCNFKFDGCDNASMYGNYCAQLNVTDSCNNNVLSNKFDVSISPSLLLAQADKVDPIYVYQNHYINTTLPNYLFINRNGNALNFYSSNCVKNSNIKIVTRITESLDNAIVNLFAKVFGDTGCQISIYTDSLACQTSEALVNIEILKCSSKACYECSGPFDSDCITCNSGFVKNSDGACVQDVNYLPSTNSTLYCVCGLFAMIVTLFSIVLSSRYGKCMFEPVMHLQSLMMLIMSSDCVSNNWIEYMSWVQYFKFDLGLLNSIWINRFVSCTPGNIRLSNVNLYCQETIINYLNLILLILGAIGLIKLMHILKCINNLCLFNKIKVDPQTIFWMLCCLILPFTIVNIVYDLSTFISHKIYSLVTSLAVIMILCYCIFKRISFCNLNFIKKIDQHKSLTYILLILSIRIPYILLFVSQSHFIITCLMIVILIMHCCLLFALISHKTKLPLDKNFDYTAEVFSNSIMLLVIMIITANKIILSSSSKCNANNLKIQEINSDAVIVLLITSMFMCYLLIGISKFASKFIIKENKSVR